MDPFSITTGILTILGACSKVSRMLEKIQSLREAPALIQAVNNEISELRLMLMDISDYLKSQKRETSTPLKVDEAIFRTCTSTLEQAKIQVLEVESLLQYQILKPESGSMRINKTAFWQHYDKLVQLQKELKNTKQKIIALSSLLGVRDVSRIEVILNDIRSHDLMMLQQGQQRIESRLDSLIALQMNTTEAEGTPRLNSSQASSPSSLSHIEVSVSRVKLYNPQQNCTCFRQRNSMRLRTCLGILFIGYAAAPITTRGQPECPHPYRRDISFTYIFPIWLARCAILLHAEIDTSIAIRCSLSFVQIIPHNHAVWDLCCLGDLEGIKNLLCSNQLSIKAENIEGKTLLRESLSAHSSKTHSSKTTQFLIEAGADIYYDTSYTVSAQRAAWVQILASIGPPQWRDCLRSLFPEPDFDETFEFSPLHKAVLELENHSLGSILCDDALEVDQTDRDWNTALSWAVRRGDVESIETLLRYGADCNRPNKLGMSPFLRAVYTSVPSVTRLIAANADINAKSMNGSTALHHATQCDLSEHEVVQIVKILIQAGAKPNALNMRGDTSLHTACQFDHAKVMALLMDNRADPKILNKEGFNVLCLSTKRNHHLQLKVLLQKHEDHIGRLEGYGTFMHLVAERADNKTLQLLAHGHLKRRNTNVKNKSGLTPYQLATQRNDVDAEWRNAFLEFFRSIDEDLAPEPEMTSGPQNTGARQDSGGPEELEGSSNDLEDRRSGTVESYEGSVAMPGGWV